MRTAEKDDGVFTMTEHIPKNELPLNKQAKALLKREGMSPDPTLLYAAQVVNFALEKGWIEVNKPDLEMWVESLSNQPPNDVMRY